MIFLQFLDKRVKLKACSVHIVNLSYDAQSQKVQNTVQRCILSTDYEQGNCLCQDGTCILKKTYSKSNQPIFESAIIVKRELHKINALLYFLTELYMTNDCTDKACQSNLEGTVSDYEILKEYLVGNETYQDDLNKVNQYAVEEVVTWVSKFNIFKRLKLRKVSQ